jgi:hypothetical protein
MMVGSLILRDVGKLIAVSGLYEYFIRDSAGVLPFRPERRFQGKDILSVHGVLSRKGKMCLAMTDENGQKHSRGSTKGDNF